MKTPMSLKTIFEIALGIVIVMVALLMLPTPIHDWFTSTTIGGVPLDVVTLALAILFTPPWILSTILRKVDVDYDDELAAKAAITDHPNLAGHA